MYTKYMYKILDIYDLKAQEKTRGDSKKFTRQSSSRPFPVAPKSCTSKMPFWPYPMPTIAVEAITKTESQLRRAPATKYIMLRSFTVLLTPQTEEI